MPSPHPVQCIDSKAVMELTGMSKGSLLEARARPKHENPFPPPMQFTASGCGNRKHRWRLVRVVEWLEEEERRAVREARRTVLP